MMSPTSMLSNRGRPGIIAASVLALVVLLVASWVQVLRSKNGGLGFLFAADTFNSAWLFLKQLLGFEGGPSTPAFLSAGRWREALNLAVDTLAMSILAIGIAALAMLVTVVPAARTSGYGNASRAVRGIRFVVFLGMRALYVFTRAVPELIWALLIIFVFTPGILAGALALAIHNFGVVGRLSAEAVENLDPRAAQALRSAGARGPQVLFYAVLPQILPQILTYVLYRWEVIMRTTIVVGFVAASGLGREFRLNMSLFQYTDVALILLVYFLLVAGGDIVSAGLRRLAR